MLTDAKLKRLLGKQQSKLLRIGDGSGLWVRVTLKGTVVFFMRYYLNGKEQEMDLGRYPALSLKDARSANDKYKALARSGKNPKLSRNKAQSGKTLNELVDLWYQKECKPGKKNHKSIIKRIKNHFSGSFGNSDNITTHQLLDKLEKISKQSPAMAAALLCDIRQVYAFGVRRRIIKDNPLVGITAKKDLNVSKRQGERYLDDKELVLLMRFIKHSDHLKRDRLALYIALHFGCRMSELRLALIEHFDFYNMIWTVPPGNHKTGGKTGKPLIRPIIQEMVPTLNELISLSGDGKSLITDKFKKTQFSSVFWTNWPVLINKWLKTSGFEEIAKWNIHCLRKTMRTNMSTITEPHVCEIMLGHKLPGVWSVYDKYQYIEEQRMAYTKWHYKLNEICKGI